MGEKEKTLEERIDAVLLKKARGEKLTRQEELLIAFCVTAPACHHAH